MNLNPPVEPMFQKPPALYEMTFESDQEEGIPFRFTATCGELGCEYDPKIGEFGGYRVPGFIDAEGDGEEDVDARITLILAADEQVIPNPDGQNSFMVDDRTEESTLKIEDHEAFGLVPPQDGDGDGVVDSADNCIASANADQRDTDGDGIGNACDADIAQPNNCIVNAADLGVLRLAFFGQPGSNNWNADADFNGDNIVNVGDLGIMKEGFFQTPGPSGLPNQCQ